MATTTNYGWTTPDDTALVKDGASAIRTLGSSVDTTTKNLNPSTTLGDIEYRSSTANTNTRLGIGSTGNVLTVAGGVPSWAAPAGGGKVLQVVSATSTTNVNITTATLTDTGITLNITPTLATSKILVLITAGIGVFRLTTAAEAVVGGCVLRDSTKILDYDLVGTGYMPGIEVGGSTLVRLQQLPAYSILDAPATTSALTYKVQAKVYYGSTSFQINGAPSTITLLEIGA